MTTEWAVTAATERIALDPTGKGSITFTVSNPGPVQDRAVLDVVTSDAAEAGWFTVELPQRVVTPQSSVAYAVVMQVPANAPAGEHWFQGRVYSADVPPEESSKLSNRIVFSVGGGKKAFPWWIVSAVFLLVLVVGVAGYLVLGRGGSPEVAPTAPTSPSPAKPVKVAMPLLNGLTEDGAKAALADKGLKVGAVKHRQRPESAGMVLQQSVAEGTEVDPGTPVDLEVGVNLAAVALSAPSNGASFPKGSAFPSLSWQPVTGAAGYRVKVQTEGCVFLLVNVACTYGEQDFYGGSYSSYHARSFHTATTNTITPTIELKVQPDVPRAGHSGNVRWMVQAVDDFGATGPESGYFTFHIVLRDPDVWGPIS